MKCTVMIWRSWVRTLVESTWGVVLQKFCPKLYSNQRNIFGGEGTSPDDWLQIVNLSIMEVMSCIVGDLCSLSALVYAMYYCAQLCMNFRCVLPGETKMTATTMRASTIRMTRRAIRMPRQFRWVGLLPTNSCNIQETYIKIWKNMLSVHEQKR